MKAQKKDFGPVLQTDLVPSVVQTVSIGRGQISVVLEILSLFYPELGFDHARKKENREQKNAQNNDNFVPLFLTLHLTCIPITA